MAPDWNDDWSGNQFSCRTGFTLQGQHIEAGGSNNANIFVCERTAAADQDEPQAVGPVTQNSQLQGFLCPDDQFNSESIRPANCFASKSSFQFPQDTGLPRTGTATGPATVSHARASAR